MSRRRKAVAALVALGVLAGASVAYAAFQGRLRANVNATKLSIAWIPATVASNDAGTALDPLTPGMSPSRDAQNIGSTEVAAATPGLITLTSTGIYDSYRASVTGDATITGGGAAQFLVQSVSLTGAPAGTTINAKMHPGVCGITLNGTPQTITFDVQYVDIAAAPATFAVGVEVNIVGAAAWQSSACNSW